MLRKRVPTRLRLDLDLLEDRLCLSTLPAGTTTTVPDAATQAHLTAAYGQLPLSFEVNKGQTDPRVNFLTQGAGDTTFLTHTSAVMELGQSSGGNVVTMNLVGASPASRAVGLDKQAGVSNDFIGNDPAKWHTDIANFAAVAYKGVYRGINLVYRGDQQQLEYDFVVQPGASAGAIRLTFDGVTGKSLDAQGDLVLHTSGGDLVEHAPVAYQVVNGVQQSVASQFVLGRGGQVGFQVGHYDHSKPLVIDPVLSLSYSTYLGGSQSDAGLAIAVDASGNAYVTGEAYSTDFPTQNPLYPRNHGGGGDVFVTKFNSTGSALVYSTYLGGNSFDSAWGIAVDSSGNAYVTGGTQSSNFPTKHDIQPGDTGGGGFLTKLNSTGSALLYSTIIPGSGDGYGLAVDSSGDAYVTGQTDSTSFLTTPGAFQTSLAGTDMNGFVTKIDPSKAGLASLVYSTYLGGNNGRSTAYGIAVNGSGNAYVTGYTGSPSFPTTASAFQPTNVSGQYDVFMSEFDNKGSKLVYSTYLGTSGGSASEGGAIAVDAAGDAYVTGLAGENFPTTTGAFRTTAPHLSAAFVAKIDPSQAGAASLVYSTYLGGDGSFYDTGYGIAVDSSGNAYVTGHTAATDFPTLNAVQAAYGGGGYDAFVTKLNPTGTGLVYSTFLGGSSYDEGTAIAVDASGTAYVTGWTESTNFPTASAFQPTKHGAASKQNVFVTKLTFT